MTLDVNIGKLYQNGFPGTKLIRCSPVHFEVCNPEYTLWPREAYRSGGQGFWDFWIKYMKNMYLKMREHPHSNDIDIKSLYPFLKDIKNLPNSQFKDHIKVIDDIDWDRLKWFKFWSLRAINLYGKDAYISFS